jgi:hypothetical protein
LAVFGSDRKVGGPHSDSAPPTGPRGRQPLGPVSAVDRGDAAVVDDDYWLLLNTADEDDGLLLVLGGQDRAVFRRLTFPGLPNAGFFAVDPSRQRLYMAPRDEASGLVFEWPGF